MGSMEEVDMWNPINTNTNGFAKALITLVNF